MPDLPNESGSFYIAAYRRIEDQNRGLILDVELFEDQ